MALLYATMTEATLHPIAVEYPIVPFMVGLTCSGHIGTVLYETRVDGQEESGYVYSE